MQDLTNSDFRKNDRGKNENISINRKYMFLIDCGMRPFQKDLQITLEQNLLKLILNEGIGI